MKGRNRSVFRNFKFHQGLLLLRLLLQKDIEILSNDKTFFDLNVITHDLPRN